MVNGIRVSDPNGLNIGRGSKFSICSSVWKETSEDGRKTHRPKRCEYNTKDEDNSPKILNDKNLNETGSNSWKTMGIVRREKYVNGMSSKKDVNLN